ncbi:uncharacterized protein LOC143630850 [Bidens hawaiensis]|uniref:uncharacterized protein LOC143630850 n=1 Tax=Bidens hawaiensis TaxID=980011 RepID=UPI00404B4536
MKRKDAGEVNDEFYYDFTLSSPALKIRRLDTELAPIINEQDISNSVEFGQSGESCPIAIDVPVNEERAIVLFNPNNNMHLIHSPIPFSISPDSNFLSRFKNPVIWSNRSDTPEPLADETQKLDDDDSGMTNGCLAVVPWVPSQSQHLPAPEFEARDAQVPDMMDSDAMDVEDNCSTQQMLKQYNHNNVAASGSQEWKQWQQHCMIQHPPSNFVTPVTWLG